MARMIVMYRHPTDPDAFDAHYFARHVPLAKAIPGLVRYEVSDGAPKSPGGESPYRLVATLEFASMAALEAGMRSPEGRAAGKDVANFAQAGADMLVFDTKTV